MKNRITVNLDKTLNNDIDIIMTNGGARNYSEAIRQAISGYARELYPLHTRPKGPVKRPTYATPEERVKAQMERQKVEASTKAALEREKGLKICEILEGTILEHQTGALTCSYKLYEKVGQQVILGEKNVAVELLTGNDVDNQYVGATKEVIIKMLSEDNK